MAYFKPVFQVLRGIVWMDRIDISFDDCNNFVLQCKFTTLNGVICFFSSSHVEHDFYFRTRQENGAFVVQRRSQGWILSTFYSQLLRQ
jgi:hypothetical protein